MKHLQEIVRLFASGDLSKEEALKQIALIQGQKEIAPSDLKDSQQEDDLLVPPVFEEGADIQDEVEKIFQTALQLTAEDLRGNASFEELGVNSLNAVELLEAINRAFDLSLPSSVMFECSHIPSLAQYIQSRLDKDQKRPLHQPVARAKESPAPIPEEEGTDIQDEIEEIFQTVLQLTAEDLRGRESFEELGVNSLNAVELLEAINQAFDLSLPSSVMFECSHIPSLAQYIQSRLDKDRKRPLHQSVARAKKTSAPMPRASLPKDPPPVITSEKSVTSSSQDPNRSAEPIAIIGLSCRCAGAKNQHEFWDLIREGKDYVTKINRPGWSAYVGRQSQPEEDERPPVSQWGGFIEDISSFDNAFFHISPAEAESMHPEHRILLEEIYTALQDGGYADHALARQSCGIFIGAMGMQAGYEGEESHLAMLGHETSILSARMAYYLDLKGPAMTINTACSSSLVAMDVAREKLLNRTIDMGIVGGITLYVNPRSYVWMSRANMLSPTGRCHPFDDRADGIVCGEGVGVVLLKRLSDARRDGDSIYGIIRGIGTNQDGKTSGITVPSFVSQCALERRVYEESKVSPETIQYVEAHGTGTKLGDPVEVHALTDAFRAFTDKTEFCALGSLKANIGHTTAAAGILGLIKVLLAMKHGKIPPLVHFEKGNRHIDFEKSPFYVSRKLKEWSVEEPQPRRAAVSSFGFSGTNAHVVLEECIVEDTACGGTSRDSKIENRGIDQPVLIVLSARDEDRLKEVVQNLYHYFTHNQEPGTKNQELTTKNLHDVAYTLQVGREAMDSRLAFCVRDREELMLKLEALSASLEKVKGVYRGKVDSDGDLSSSFAADEDLEEAIRRWMAKGKLDKLAEFWVKGFALDWSALYGESKPKRVSLPGYPFARKPYPIPLMEEQAVQSVARPAALHPLVERNTSDLTEQQFSTRLTGHEFFLKDHRIEKEMVLPGVAYLEMARAAGVLAGKRMVRKLKDVVWIRPVIVNSHPQDVKISLYPLSDQLAFEVSAEGDGAEEERRVHSQGVLEMVEGEEEGRPMDGLDIEAIQARCKESCSGEDYYALFAQGGVHYGPAFQGIERLVYNEEESLAYLRLPEAARADSEPFLLHPSLMDGAVQASMGLTLASSVRDYDAQGPLLPFALGEVCIHGPLLDSVYAYVRYSPNIDPRGRVLKYDILITDEEGRILVALKEVAVRAFHKDRSPVEGSAASQAMPEILYLVPEWKKELLPAAEEEAAAMDQIILLADQGRDLSEAMLAEYPQAEIIMLSITGASIGAALERRFIEVLERIKKRLEASSGPARQIMLLIPDTEKSYVYAPFTGLLKTARLEHPKIWVKIIYYTAEPKQDHRPFLTFLREELHPAARQDLEVRYGGGERKFKRLVEVNPAPSEPNMGPPLKTGGVYWITGGLGGLGRIFAEAFAKISEITLVLSGRSALGEQEEAHLSALRQTGLNVDYLPADMTKKREVAKAFETIKKKYGVLNGIIHGAGAVHDAFILKKTGKQIRAVLGPKIKGTLHVDDVTQKEPLDFFIFFSSATGVFGNIGQSDYAGANAFLDAFAAHRSEQVAAGVRFGKTLSIGWSLWEEGGMEMDEQNRQRVEELSGMIPMPAAKGVEAFAPAFRSAWHHVVVMYGDPHKVRDLLRHHKLADRPARKRVPLNEDTSTRIDQKQLKEQALDYLKKQLSGILKMPASQIGSEIPLEKYGIDSVMAMQLTNQLEKSFGALSKTLFFEYQTIEELADYFLETHADQLHSMLHVEGRRPDAHEAASEKGPVDGSDQPKIKRPRFSSRAVLPRETRSSEGLDIAIIGLSGRYPQARDLGAYWQNLRKGKDCITEIPRERWDWRTYYSENEEKPGGHISKWGGFIEDVDKFDPLFFNISPREAEFMDPQERLFLEHVWMALEDAGYSREKLRGEPGEDLPSQVGVYAGVMYGEYQLFGAEESVRGNPQVSGGSYASIANRVSYLLDLHGPSMTVDTMCSSSLTSLHLACQDLKHGRTDMGIAGGVNVTIHPNKYLLLSRGQFLSTEGRCESFGEGGDGYIPGEGVGVALLKRLEDAVRDEDRIYGVIKGSAINHGGKTNGYTVPNPKAQQMVIARALKESRVDPGSIGYIETHGTGTKLGDPIEITGLSKAFGSEVKKIVVLDRLRQIKYRTLRERGGDRGFDESLVADGAWSNRALLTLGDPESSYRF